MALLPVADGARLLGIHPKTLHHWLKEADIPPAMHPTDARIKCVSEEHLHQVACLHGRSLQAPALVDPPSPPLMPPEARYPHVSKPEGESASTPCSFLTCCGSGADLTHNLSRLETRVATLQEHVTQLSLALLKVQEQSIEHHLTTLETLLQARGGGEDRSLHHQPLRECKNPCVLHGSRDYSTPLNSSLVLACLPWSNTVPQGCMSSLARKKEKYRCNRIREHGLTGWRLFLPSDSSGLLAALPRIADTNKANKHATGQLLVVFAAIPTSTSLRMTESLTIANLERTAASLQADIDAR